MEFASTHHIHSISSSVLLIVSYNMSTNVRVKSKHIFRERDGYMIPVVSSCERALTFVNCHQLNSDSLKRISNIHNFAKFFVQKNRLQIAEKWKQPRRLHLKSLKIKIYGDAETRQTRKKMAVIQQIYCEYSEQRKHAQILNIFADFYRRSKLEETKLKQKLREKPNGVDIVGLTAGKKIDTGDVASKKTKTGGMVNMKNLKAGKLNQVDDAYDVCIGTQFSAETNKRDEDEEMMK